MNSYVKMLINMGKEAAKNELRNLSKKEAAKDADNTGADDARARVYASFADTLDKVDFTGIENPKSLKSIGKYFEAFGKRLQQEAGNLDDSED